MAGYRVAWALSPVTWPPKRYFLSGVSLGPNKEMKNGNKWQ